MQEVLRQDFALVVVQLCITRYSLHNQRHVIGSKIHPPGCVDANVKQRTIIDKQERILPGVTAINFDAGIRKGALHTKLTID